MKKKKPKRSQATPSVTKITMLQPYWFPVGAILQK